MGQLEFVQVVSEGGIERRFIRTGHQSPELGVSVLSGVGEGEEVVWDGPTP